MFAFLCDQTWQHWVMEQMRVRHLVDCFYRHHQLLNVTVFAQSCPLIANSGTRRYRLVKGKQWGHNYVAHQGEPNLHLPLTSLQLLLTICVVKTKWLKHMLDTFCRFKKVLCPLTCQARFTIIPGAPAQYVKTWWDWDMSSLKIVACSVNAVTNEFRHRPLGLDSLFL